MGPYSEETQEGRREAIKRLLDSHPDMDPVTIAMWQRHLDSIAVSEEEYNARVKEIYSKMKKGVIEYE